MNQNSMDTQNGIRYKKPIILMSIISLFFISLSYIICFVIFDYMNTFRVIEFVSFLLRMATCVLLLLYVVKFHKKFNATILVPIVFGLLAIYPLFDIRSISMLFFHVPFIMVPFVFATINALEGLTNKIILRIAIAVGIIVEFIYLATFIIDIIRIDISRYEGYIVYIIGYFCGITGRIVLYLALLLFGLTNRIPSIIPVSPEKMNPEKELRILKDKLDSGMITEEEYQIQRAKIISKL